MNKCDTKNKRRGRPKLEGSKSRKNIVKVRLSDAEAKKIKDGAKSSKETVSEYIRALLKTISEPHF